ncbi:MAG: glycosyl hydrolase 115 family protein [Terracidiphilus sp.]
MRTMAAAALCIAPLAAATNAQTRPMTIDGAVTIVVSSQEPAAVHRAATDLRSDLARVFGQTPRLVSRLEDAGPDAILIAQGSNLPAGAGCAKAAGTEAFAFSIVRAPPEGKAKQVACLSGADARGTIYAIYEFSQKVLGVDPMYLWTDKEPQKRKSIQLPADFAQVYPSPVFRYRGFFINDEDLLTGWMPAAKGEQTGISLKAWDRVFETILRLKGNMIVPGSWIFPDDAQIHAATERGLIVNQHHATPLGVNVARWPKDVPYNFSTHPEILERAWTNAVATYRPDDEILWTVGLRGLSDESYADLDPSVRNNDPLLGQRVSQAIAEQMKIVRARYPNAHFITNLWQEGDRLMREGYLQIPPEVTLVWADVGYGDMLDGGKVAAGQGAYIHVAMMNFHTNQLSEMVPVKKLQSELGRYIQAGATGFLLINTSDIRPVAMTARAVMEIGWGGAPKEASDSDGAYYRRWATEEFGARSASALEEVYKLYFAAPELQKAFPAPGGGQFAPRLVGDQHYHTDARYSILDRLSGHQAEILPGQSPKWAQPIVEGPGMVSALRAMRGADIENCAAAQPRWDAVWNKAVAAESLVDPARRNYYQAQVLTMIAINRESNRMLLDVARAVDDDNTGQTEKARREIDEALAALDSIQQSMSAAEYGRWKNWYRGDWLTGVHRTRELVQAYANHLKDPMAPLPAPVEWNGWEGYFHIMEYEGDRTVDVH